jgi:hypothetical protein
MRGARRRLGLAAVLGLLAACALAGRTPPPVPDPWPGRGLAEWGAMWLPALREPPSAAFAREPSKAVAIRRGEGVEALLAYDPADGGARHRLDVRTPLSWPAGAESGDLRVRPALLVLAEAEAPWHEASACPGDEWWPPQPRMFLGGRLPGGEIGAVPYFADAAAEEEVTRLGAALTPHDLAVPGCLEIRITRDGAAVRYRFGHSAYGVRGPRRWDGGDVRIAAEAVLAAGDGPLIPALAALLAERFETPHGPRNSVFLEVGEGVRYVDVLRAVECAGGSGEVVFFGSWLWPREIGDVTLADPAAPADAPALVEDYGRGRRVIVNVRADGRTFVKGVTHPADRLPAVLADAEAALVRADRSAAYGAVREVLRAAAREGKGLELSFGPEEPGFEPERFLAVPRPPAGAPVVSAVVPVPGGAWAFAADPGDPRGRAFRLDAADDVPAGAVLQAALRLLARGAVGIVF